MLCSLNCAQVAVLLLTEITPKSIAVHNATEVARFVVSVCFLLLALVNSFLDDFEFYPILLSVYVLQLCSFFVC